MTTHTLYRFYDTDGHLLYVGRTTNPGRRWREHEKRAPWFQAVSWVTREVYPTAEAVDVAEREAIANEHPIHNIALNGARHPPMRSTRPVIVPQGDDLETHRVRLNAIAEAFDEDPTDGCLGDEVVCECFACHHKRLMEFENLRAKYEWHPDIRREIATVERTYFAGAALCSWYDDLFDIELLWTMELAIQSAVHPIPAYAEPSAAGVTVDCPFCFQRHTHFMPAGASFDHPLAAGCPTEVLGGVGQYVLLDDWMDMNEALYAWGERHARAAA